MNESTYEYCIAHQYELPRRLYSFAKCFRHVTFYQALRLYELSVEEVITTYDAENLYDGSLGFGRGLVLAKNEWLKKMEKIEEALRKNEDKTED